MRISFPAGHQAQKGAFFPLTVLRSGGTYNTGSLGDGVVAAQLKLVVLHEARPSVRAWRAASLEDMRQAEPQTEGFESRRRGEDREMPLDEPVPQQHISVAWRQTDAGHGDGSDDEHIMRCNENKAGRVIDSQVVDVAK